MKLIFVRHGRTYFNEIRLTQGWCDSPLSRTGQKQVQDMRRQLLDIPITRAYSSNLGRAVETAEVLLEDREVELVYDKRLKEINFGIPLKGKINSLNASVAAGPPAGRTGRRQLRPEHFQLPAGGFRPGPAQPPRHRAGVRHV